MKYRIETVFVPSAAGIANPGSPTDKSADLGNRRIVHVLNVTPRGQEGEALEMLTEEAS